MKSAYLILLTCLFSNLYNLVLANDGSYLTKGGLFYPTTETKISMDKEVLSFKVVNGWCEVNVAFEFNNPEKEARKLTVGFQAPTAVGDVDEETQSTNMIKDFLIQQNGNLLSYQLKIAECEDCPLQEIGSWSPKHQGDGGVFVYLFATKEMLRILRNTIYAQHGLTFSSGDLKNYFSQFDWYIPVPNLKQNEIILSNEELELLHLIQQKEKELSND